MAELAGPFYLQEDADDDSRLQLHAAGRSVIGYLQKTAAGFELTSAIDDLQTQFADRSFARAEDALEAITFRKHHSFG